MPPTIQTREALSWKDPRPDPLPSFPTRGVFLCHPLDSSFILRLPCVDNNGATVQFGVVTHAFRVFSGNRDGKLHQYSIELREVGDAIKLGWDEGVEQGQVTWIVEDGSPQGLKDWAIVPNFKSWIGVPSRKVCREWKEAFGFQETANIPSQTRSDVKLRAKLRDKKCLVSGGNDGLEGVHVIPTSGSKWLVSGNGTPLRLEIEGVDTPENVIALAGTIHTVYDMPSFVIVPTELGHPTIHFIKRSSDTFSLYSNRKLRHLSDASAATHYARFAWSILGLAEHYLNALARTLRVRIGVNGDWQEFPARVYSTTLVEEEIVAVKEAKVVQEKGGIQKKRKADGNTTDCSQERAARRMLEEETAGQDDMASATSPSKHFSDLDRRGRTAIMTIAEEIDAAQRHRLALVAERQRHGVDSEWGESEEESEQDWPVLTPMMRMWVEEAREVRRTEGRENGG